MDQNQASPHERAVSTAAVPADLSTAFPAAVSGTSQTIEPQACSTCGATPGPGTTPKRGPGTTPALLYVFGTIDVIFPSRWVEKEFAQAASRMETKGLTDRQLLHKVLSEEENLYLAVECCYLLRKHDIETFVLVPRREGLLKTMIEALRHDPKPYDFHVVVGEVVGISPPEKCNGLTLPLAVVDQTYFSNRETLIKSIPKSDKVEADAFAKAAEEVFDRIMRMADNHGLGPDRAINCAALRYGELYRAVAEAYARDESLAGVDAHYSLISGPQEIVEIALSFVNRKTGVVMKHCMTMNTSGKYPFVVSPLAPCW